jgi:hypothetical protein
MGLAQTRLPQVEPDGGHRLVDRLPQQHRAEADPPVPTMGLPRVAWFDRCHRREILACRPGQEPQETRTKVRAARNHGSEGVTRDQHPDPDRTRLPTTFVTKIRYSGSCHTYGAATPDRPIVPARRQPVRRTIARRPVRRAAVAGTWPARRGTSPRTPPPPPPRQSRPTAVGRLPTPVGTVPEDTYPRAEDLDHQRLCQLLEIARSQPRQVVVHPSRTETAV